MRGKGKEYSQDHKKVTEQTEAVGHAVRATYMYAGMADVAAITGDKAYLNAIDKIWEDIIDDKFYLTGASARRVATKDLALLTNCRICRPTTKPVPPLAIFIGITAFFCSTAIPDFTMCLSERCTTAWCRGCHSAATAFLSQSAGIFRATLTQCVVWLRLLPEQCLSVYPVGSRLCLCPTK